MGLTTDPNEKCLKDIKPDGQQCCYLILSEEERAKGFVMPVRKTYRHMKCGSDTTMGLAIAETYAARPTFYGGTFCCFCGSHFDLWGYVEGLLDAADVAMGRVLHKQAAFYWVEPDGDRAIPVGATPKEADALWQAKREADAAKIVGQGI